MSATLAGAVAAQTRTEVRLTLRRGENVLITLIVPAVLLVFFASLGIVPAGPSAIAFLLPGMLALAVISTGMVSLGIATAYERHYRVLKRLGGTPLPRGGLIAAKAMSVLVIEVAQVLLLGLIGLLVYGWRPGSGAIAAIGVLLLGTAAFAGIGLAMAGIAGGGDTRGRQRALSGLSPARRHRAPVGAACPSLCDFLRGCCQEQRSANPCAPSLDQAPAHWARMCCCSRPGPSSRWSWRRGHSAGSSAALAAGGRLRGRLVQPDL